MRIFLILATVVACLISVSLPSFGEERYRIRDNSFLIEEAYNQEEGVIQFIQNFQYLNDKTWIYNFTNEIPVFSEKHQLSYTIPVVHLLDASWDTGIADILLNYRYQLVNIEAIALAPRFSLIMPTGSASKGLGRNSVGFQTNIPLSVDIGDYVNTSYNVGLTFTPKAESSSGTRKNTWDFNAGGNIIVFAHDHLNLMLEIFYSSVMNNDDANNLARDYGLYLNPGLRGSIDFDCGLQIVPGIAAPIGIGPSNGDYGIYGYLSFEFQAWKPAKKEK